MVNGAFIAKERSLHCVSTGAPLIINGGFVTRMDFFACGATRISVNET